MADNVCRTENITTTQAGESEKICSGLHNTIIIHHCLTI